MSNLTHEHINHLHKRGESLHRRLEKLREKLAGTTAKAVRTVEVSAGALIGGVIQGHAGPEGAHVFHVPTDLGAGLVLNLLGYFDAAGDEYSDHLNNFGDGFLAAYVSGLGFAAGKKWSSAGSFTAMFKKDPAAGALPAGTAASGAYDMNPNSVADIIARARGM